MRSIHFYFVTVVLSVAVNACQQHNGKQQAATRTVIDSDVVSLQIVTNAVTSPVQMSLPGDGTHRIFITDHIGKIWIMKKDSLLPKPFLDITAKSQKKEKEKGELDLGTINGIAFHPQFATNHLFYVCYNAATTVAGNKCKLVVSSFSADKMDIDLADTTSEHRVFELEGIRIFANGAGIAFGPDGYLYISIGDDALGDSSYVYHAQDLDYLNGKLLRIDVNKTPYAIPPDNPFVGVQHARPEIWAYGFRKMWRFCFDAKSHQLFGADVGENKDEEIDIVSKGANYGWPVLEGDSIFTPGKAAAKNNFTSPINAYPRKDGICAIGGSIYYGKAIPFLQNKFVFGDFNGSIFTLTNNAKGEWMRQVLSIRNKPADPFLICALGEDSNNEMYAMGLLNAKAGPKGAVYKIIK